MSTSRMTAGSGAGARRRAARARKRIAAVLLAAAGAGRGSAATPPKPAAPSAAVTPAAASPPAGAPEAKPAAPVPRFRVFLDPGHGGKPENQSRRTGAHWDPRQGKFLSYYRFGSEYRAKGGVVVSEQAQVLALAKKVRQRLAMTTAPGGWPGFRRVLARVAGHPGPFPPVKVETRIAREDDFESHPEAGAKDINKHFRIFDGPASFPHKPGGPMIPGRLSASAAFSPHLQLSLHIDGSSNKNQRGMSALFVPSPGEFETARKVVLGISKPGALGKKIRRYWSYRGHSRTKLGWLLNDTWTYFTGYGAVASGKAVRTAAYIGQRWQHLDWAYADPDEAAPVTSLDGPFDAAFFFRERGEFERRRRGGGAEGVGGDNLYAGAELLRFLRLGWWRDYKGGGGGWKAGLAPAQYVPPPQKPTAADWAMPLHTNAVAPFLELGQLQNYKDRYLLTKKLDVAADALAAGIYSLLVGLKITPIPGIEAPVGTPVGWAKYALPGGGSYFEESHPKNRGAVRARAAAAAARRVEARKAAAAARAAAAGDAGDEAAAPGAPAAPGGTPAGAKEEGS